MHNVLAVDGNDNWVHEFTAAHGITEADKGNLSVARDLPINARMCKLQCHGKSGIFLQSEGDSFTLHIELQTQWYGLRKQMVISSRTPEGSPNRYPVCGTRVWVEPSLFFGDAPCPACGQLLWFLTVRSEQRFFLPDEAVAIRERLLERVAENLGVNREAVLRDPAFLKETGADSLDLVELMMELEEQLE
jgi:acyl carrier protein